MVIAANKSKLSIGGPARTEIYTGTIQKHKLKVSVREIGRYAGGSRYKMDARMKNLAADMLKRAEGLLKPVFTYGVHPVKSLDSQNRAELIDGTYVEMPVEERDASMKALVASICTLGADLEKTTADLMHSGNALESVLLDAAGVAYLESLAHFTRRHIKNTAAKYGLYAGCPFGPGYGNMPLESQSGLFEHIDAAAIGVRLNNSGVMLPMKSLSFWLRLTENPQAAEDKGYKCRRCGHENCAFRKVAFHG